MCPETDNTLKQLVKYGRDTGEYECDVHIIYNQSMIVFARNMLIDAFNAGKNEKNYDYMFFLDADICTTEYNALSRLIAHNKDVICGVYPCKNPPFNPALMTFERWEKKGRIFENFAKYPNPHRIKYGATGFMLIARRVLDKVGDTPFNLRNYTLPGKEKFQMPEDYSFCDLCAKHNFQIWLDHTIPLSHIGIYKYSLNDFYSFCQYYKFTEGQVLPAMECQIK